ncbi:MAG: helix-turn-helix domain-containing protein [Gemmatimonadaceae bacterium]
MSENNVPGGLLRSARAAAGMSQRELARKARTTQSVIARIELGESNPTWTTMSRLLRAAGFRLSGRLQRIRKVDPQELDDVSRILALTPEQRLREVALADGFVSAARRV